MGKDHNRSTHFVALEHVESIRVYSTHNHEGDDLKSMCLRWTSNNILVVSEEYDKEAFEEILGTMQSMIIIG